MRCEEVKRLLDEFTDDNRELLEHIENCPRCAIDYEAHQLIKSALENNRNDNISEETPFHLLREKLENRIEQNKIEEFGFMARVKKEIKTHPKLSVGFTAAITVFAFMLLVPFSYDRTVGYDVILAGFDNGNISTEMLSDVSAVLGHDDITVESNYDNSIVLSDFPSKRAAKEVADAISTIAKINSPITIRPIVQKSSGSLFAQAKEKIMKIEIELKDKSDAEVEAEIEKMLLERGADKANVKVTTNSEGMREITMDIIDSSDSKYTERQTKILVIGDDKISFDGPDSEITVESDGKTVAEIEADIQRQMDAKGMKDAEVEVTIDADGQKRIEIKIEKDEKIDR